MGFCGCPLMLDERVYILAEGVVLFWADVKVPEMARDPLLTKNLPDPGRFK